MVQRYLVPAVKRAFQIIEMLAKHDSGARISEIHRALSFPLSSAATIVYTLADLGYLERDPVTSCYRLSLKMFGIGRHALDRKGLAAECHGLLEELVRQTGLTGHLAVLQGTDSMYIDRVQSDSLVQLTSYVGMRWPLHTSAVGKALLAFRPEREMQSMLKNLTLRKLTPHTISSKAALEKQLRQFRKQGYTWELNEGERGMGCVAAPVFGARQELAAAISLTGTTHEITRAKIPSLGAQVMRFAEAMSVRLGAAA